MSPRLPSLLPLALGLSLLSGGVIAACGGGDGNAGGAAGAGGQSAGGAGGAGGEGTGGELFTSTSTGTTQSLDVQPSAQQTLQVDIGQQTPTVTYTATLDGQPVNAGWNVDRGNIGTVAPGPSSTTVFTPTGTTGGFVKVLAGLNQQTVERSILVQLRGEQNGYDPTNPEDTVQVPTTPGDLTNGGGVGGVGGEGLGPAVTDPALLAALDNPVGDGQAEGLKLLYPYDKTVWPRSLLAPNVMWRWTLGDADAIKIELGTTTGSFSWKGTFGRPAILAAIGKPFIRHPIPQSIWRMATNTAGGADRLTMRLTVARNGQAYGPLEQTWTIAEARLSGIIYYNSYGTQLAYNYSGAVGGNGQFGGAVLSIRGGDPGPALAAGASGTSAQCRVCHSVAADGSRMVAQHGDNSSVSSAYDLTQMTIPEVPLAVGAEFPGLSPDGSMMLTPAAALRPLPDDATPLPATGLTAVATNVGTPIFSPDGTRVAFNPMSGGSTVNPKQKLVVMSFDPATFAFSSPIEVVDYTGQPAEHRPGWPAFFPDGNAVVFHTQIVAGSDGNNLGDLRTRKGAKAELAWTRSTDGAAVTPLDQLNGKDANGVSYLPKLDAPIVMSCTGDGVQVGNIDPDHADDVHLNYEPTVSPVASGGYAWVVFTSRRLYGNVAEIPPFCSDPRGVDLIQNITTKKLWVAAIDITGQPGADASHPAFYLPGQELLAGNSRGFWVQNQCKMDGAPCEAGDECCGGHCQPNDAGELVCQYVPPGGDCSGPQEACTTSSDCCDPRNLCINGFCVVQPPT